MDDEVKKETIQRCLAIVRKHIEVAHAELSAYNTAGETEVEELTRAEIAMAIKIEISIQSLIEVVPAALSWSNEIVCPNCGSYRTMEAGVLQACGHCGDEETEPVDIEKIP